LSIKATAKKYGVEPVQIRKWKKAFEDAMTKAIEAPVIPGRDNPTITKTYRHLSSIHHTRFTAGGRPTLFSDDFLAKIKKIIEERRRNDLSVHMSIIRTEARKIHPSLFDHVAESAFNARMYRIMKKWEISICRRTTTSKVPQTTRHVEEVTREFVNYFKFKVRLHSISS
jgi:L-2-hydroxyglutarate oxidase LhgO